MVRKAADQGHADAQYNLGVAYEHGQGVPKDDAQAAAWLRKAAAKGNAEAMIALALMYSHAQGVSLNYEVALQWAKEGGGVAKSK